MDNLSRQGVFTQAEDDSAANQACRRVFMELYIQQKLLMGAATAARNHLNTLFTDWKANAAAMISPRVYLCVCQIQLTDQGLISRMRVKWRPERGFLVINVFMLHVI